MLLPQNLLQACRAALEARRLCTSRARYVRASFEYRRNPVRRPRSSADLRSDCCPNIDQMFADARSIYGRPVYEFCDPKIRHWKIAELRTGFDAPAANVGRSLKIAAEPAVMPTSHIQRSPAEIVDRPNVAEFQIRQGVERIFCLKCTLSHFGRARAVPFEN